MTAKTFYRLRLWADHIQSSYWFTTGLIVMASIVLVVVVQMVDRALDVHELWALSWLSDIGVDGARAVLSAIAGSTITVAGVIFSITIVALTMASSQFGPRLLRNFMKSGSTQWALGTFIGCFIYALLTLTRVPSDTQHHPVPFASVAVGVLLGIISFLVLIYYIHRTALMIRAPQIIDSVGREAIKTLERVFPAKQDRNTDESAAEADKKATGAAAGICSTGSGYIQTIEVTSLLDLACRNESTIQTHVKVGHYVIRGQCLATVYDIEDPDDSSLLALILGSIILGPERTATQDAEFAIDQLVEIAVRSLSPGINDPFTAIHCVDQMGAVLAVLNDRLLPSPRRYDQEGRLRLILQVDTCRSIVDSAFNQIRQNALGHPPVLMRLLETIRVLADTCDDTTLKWELQRQADTIYESGIETISHAADREGFQRRYAEALGAFKA